MHVNKLLIGLFVLGAVVGCGGGGGGSGPDDSLRNEVGKLKEELTQRGREKSNLDGLLGKVKEELNQAQREKDALKTSAGSLETDKNDLLEKLAEHVREKETLEKLSQTLKANADTCRANADSFKSSADTFKSNNETLKSTTADLEAKLRSFNDPLEMFKRRSEEFIANLGPRKLFGDRKENLFQTFRKKLAFVADAKHLFEKPMPGSAALTLPLPLVFDVAPKPKMPFTVYVAYQHGGFDDEKTAKFILATDDQTLVGNDSYAFKVPEKFPILYLGKRIFMLPKQLFDPLYESPDSSQFIPLDYDFEANDNEPYGYDVYVKNLAIRNTKDEQAKSSAAEMRQKELDARNGSTSP